MLDPKKLTEIVEDAFAPHNSYYNAPARVKARELVKAKQAIDEGQWYSANDERIVTYQQKLRELEVEMMNSPNHLMKDTVNDARQLEQKKRITQVVGAEWKFNDETLDEYKLRIYGNQQT